MSKLLLTFLLLTFMNFAFGQIDQMWVRVYDSTTRLSGYKDLMGNIKIPARFNHSIRADTFFHIIAVSEQVDSSYKSYYLLKDGRKVGQDSVFEFDFTFDCESEEKIIFYDRKKNRVCFLNKNGVAIIPAIYNYVSRFHNGLAIAHQNAKRACWEEDGDTTNCEHLSWVGGESILINERNEILVDSLDIDIRNINWYSKLINAVSVDTSIYTSIKGRNNTTYSFIDFDKEFRNWFYNNFLRSVRLKNNLDSLLFDELTFWSEKQGWTSLEKNAFLQTFITALEPKRFETNKLKEMSITQSGLNELIFDKDMYKKYLNSCGEHNWAVFPQFNVLLTYYKKRRIPISGIQSQFFSEYEIDYQENFEFLRTAKGYKLLSVSIKN